MISLTVNSVATEVAGDEIVAWWTDGDTGSIVLVRVGGTDGHRLVADETPAAIESLMNGEGWPNVTMTMYTDGDDTATGYFPFASVVPDTVQSVDSLTELSYPSVGKIRVTDSVSTVQGWIDDFTRPPTDSLDFGHLDDLSGATTGSSGTLSTAAAREWKGRRIERRGRVVRVSIVQVDDGSGGTTEAEVFLVRGGSAVANQAVSLAAGAGNYSWATATFGTTSIPGDILLAQVNSVQTGGRGLTIFAEFGVDT